MDSHVNRSIDHLDSWMKNRYIGNTIINVIFMLIGIFGNILVIYVYKTKLRRKRQEERYFIIVLAVIDFLHSIFSSCLVFSKNSNPLTFPSDALCKILLFGTNVFFVLSLLVLVIICIHRYRKICRPFKTQMTQKTQHLTVFFVSLFAVVFALPKLIYFKVRPLKINFVYGSVCASDMKMSGAIIFVAWMTKFWIAFAGASVIVMAVLYTFVGRVTYRQMKMFKLKHQVKEEDVKFISDNSHSGDNNTSGVSLTSKESNSPLRKKKADKPSTHSKSPSLISKSSHTTVTTFTMSSGLSQSPSLKSISSHTIGKTNTLTSIHSNSPSLLSKRSHGRMTRSVSVVSALHSTVRTHRLSLMFIAITVITILSYIPTWIFVLFDARNPKRWLYVTDLELQLFLFMRCLHAVGYVANPVIYAYYDPAFRREVVRVICRVNANGA